MSQSAERVQKFEEDAKALISSSTLKETKVLSEVKRLRTWLTKHQDDAIPAGDQGKLWNCVRSYRSVPNQSEALDSATLSLLEDYLKMPEGKLVNGKSKQTALKMYESSAGGAGSAAGGTSASSAVKERKFLVSDVEEAGGAEVATVVSAKGDDVLEGVPMVSAELAAAIKAKLDSDGECE
eukprot:gene9087-16210_t